MKKLLGVLVCLLALGLCVTALAIDDIQTPGIPIDAEHFPDAGFREVLSAHYDTNEDGYLSKLEIAATADFTCEYFQYKEIKSLEGIAYFTELVSLDCGQNSIEKLDVSKNTKLAVIRCRRNGMKTLTLGNLPQLNILDCSENALDTLDISGCPNLRNLDCNHNMIKSMDLSKNTKLQNVDVSDNLLESLNVNGCSEIIFLYCYNNSLDSLDLRQAEKLKEIATKGTKDPDTYKTQDRYRLGEHVLSVDAGLELIVADPEPVPEITPEPELPPEDPEPVVPEPQPDPEIVIPTTVQPEPDHVDSASNAHYAITVDGSGKPSASFTKPNKPGKTVSIPDIISVVLSPDNIVEVPVVSIAPNAFKGDKKLTTVTIGKNVETIGKNAFASCAKLKTIKGGKSVKTISTGAFSGNKKLTAFPALSKLETIGASAFKNCTALTKVTIGAKVKSIGKSAFQGCKKLKTITIKSTKLTKSNVKSNAFKGIYAKATIKCPKSKLKTYQKWLPSKGVPKTAKITK